MKTTFTRKDGICVSFNRMTLGQTLALCNALNTYKSAVGEDVKKSLFHAIHNSTDKDKDLFNIFLKENQ